MPAGRVQPTTDSMSYTLRTAEIFNSAAAAAVYTVQPAVSNGRDVMCCGVYENPKLYIMQKHQG